jgi:hypothetical protein
LNTRLYKLIETYAGYYNSDTLTEAKAKELTDGAIAIEVAELELKKSYLPKFYSVRHEGETLRTRSPEPTRTGAPSDAVVVRTFESVRAKDPPLAFYSNGRPKYVRTHSAIR